MRRKISGSIIAVIIAFISWAIPKYMDVKNMITPDNAIWLLRGTIIGLIVAGVVLIWGFWSNVKRILQIVSNIRRLRLTLKPVKRYVDVNPRVIISNTQEQLTSQDRELLDSYKRQANYDRFHLRDLLIVRNERLLQQNLDPIMGGQLQFAFDVFNGSILPVVKVGYSITGNLMVQSREFHDRVEPQTPMPIYHGNWATIAIKQRILPEVIKEIRDGASKSDGIVLSFDFKNVHIYAEDEGGTQGLSLQNTLNIAEIIKFRVKRDNIKDADFYTWKRIYETNSW
jgi:hypothetical protein